MCYQNQDGAFVEQIFNKGKLAKQRKNDKEKFEKFQK